MITKRRRARLWCPEHSQRGGIRARALLLGLFPGIVAGPLLYSTAGCRCERLRYDSLRFGCLIEADVILSESEAFKTFPCRNI